MKELITTGLEGAIKTFNKLYDTELSYISTEGENVTFIDSNFNYTLELAQDLRAIMGLDPDEELMNMILDSAKDILAKDTKIYGVLLAKSIDPNSFQPTARVIIVVDHGQF